MKLKTRKKVNHLFRAATMLPTAALGVGLTLPASITHATIATPDEIVVTARRTEEVTQNVPIAMTVFNQEMLTERNVTTGSDLVAYTPSLSVNNRFGSDQSSFAIRGFTQELRTSASVAVYFADVVAPRGGGNVTAGDGAGPGAFFDLQNVQVLKGPQGTLFGRNTTGGAIQLVPQEPTSQLEGYLELSGGNYDMRRVQGVINVPITDTARARFGLDKMTREGYLDNVSGIGPDHLADVDYTAVRAGLIVDITDSLENYSIFTHTKSENNGNIQKLIACVTTPSGLANFFAGPCRVSLAKQGNDFYNVLNAHADPEVKIQQWQFINTTTWNASDSFTLKNILSYADLKHSMETSVFGFNFTVNPSIFNQSLPNVNYPNFVGFNSPSWAYAGHPTNSQTTFVEELQASGSALNEKLTWQAGIYYENSKPDGWTGSQSVGMVSCGYNSLSGNPIDYDCFAPLSLVSAALTGFVQENLNKVEYLNQAVYSQATYDLSDEWRATLGVRYSVDETDAHMKSIAYTGGNGPSFPQTITCTYTRATATFIDQCLAKEHTKSEAPTWLIDVDYLPNPDMMFYAKYARGYRQGAIVTAAPLSFKTFDPEEVDAYEVGAKTSFRSMVQGTFNVAVFYNELKDQQLQVGLLPLGSSPTTAIFNAGKSTIQGFELETTVKLLDDLVVNLGYTYLETHLDSADFPTLLPGIASVNPAAIEGEHLTFSPRHTAIVGFSYSLPLPREVGDISFGANYTYTSDQNSSSPSKSEYSVLPDRQLLSLSAGWKKIYGSRFDASLFVTNALDEEYISYVAATLNSTGAETGVTGEPRMYGARVKYNF